MLDMKNMSKESREAEIDRILAETARTPYKPKSKPATEEKSEESALAEHGNKTESKKTASTQRAFEELESERQAKAAAAEKIRKIKEERRKAELRVEKPAENNEAENSNDYFDEFLPESETEELFEFSEDKNVSRSRRIVFNILDVCQSIIIAVFIVMLVFTYVFRNAVVTGDSMAPTLNDGDRLLALAFGKPDSGDIVVINGATANLIGADGAVTQKDGIGGKMIKRVIAVGGDTIDFDFDNGIAYVNGSPLEESYISEPTTRDERAFEYPLTVPEGYCFVMGDNRNISKDSRHEDIGLVSENDIIGKVLLRAYPFDKMGSVK